MSDELIGGLNQLISYKEVFSKMMNLIMKEISGEMLK